MPTGATIALFAIAAGILLIIPGPSVLYIVTRSIDQGRRAGIVSVLGVQVGTLCHSAAAALGISALLMSSALAFTAVKYVGGAYLIYLGARKLLGYAESEHTEVAAPRSHAHLFYEGFLVNLLNPKTALFFFAFLPQFVDPARGAVAQQIMILGSIMMLMGICSDSSYALLAGTAGKWLKGSTSFLKVQRYVIGCIYIALGLTAVLATPARKS